MKRSHWGDKNAAGPEAKSGQVHIEDLMAEHVTVLSRHHTVDYARRLMTEHGIHCLPVAATDGELIGILTSTDLLESVQGDTLVGKVMVRDVQTVPRYGSPHVAARLMLRNRIHHLVVTHEHKIVGVLSSFDLLRLVEDRRFVVKNRPSTPKKKIWEKRQASRA